MLTKKQYELLTFINQRLKETGISPSFDEMKDALDLRSKSGIHRLVNALEERGFIRRITHRARALEIIKLPNKLTARLSKTHNPHNDDTTPQPTALKQDTNDSDESNTVSIGVMGRIAAGTPIEALQEESHKVSMPVEMLGSGQHYALEVQGDSMIDAGILDGDTAIIQKCDTANNGEIVVALVDNHEATLKRLRRKGEMIALEPANATYETRLFHAHQIKIQGRLVSLARKY